VGSFCNPTVRDGSHPTRGTRPREAGYWTRATGKLDLDPDRRVGVEAVDTDHGHASSPDVASLFRRPTCYRTGERPGVDGGPGRNATPTPASRPAPSGSSARRAD